VRKSRKTEPINDEERGGEMGEGRKGELETGRERFRKGNDGIIE
jgi:hypothetical protein